MKRPQNKKAKLRDPVGKTPNDAVSPNGSSRQDVHSSITPPHPLETKNWLAGIRAERHAQRNLYVAILSIVVMAFCAWFFSSRTVNLPLQQPTPAEQSGPNIQKTSSGSNLLAQPSGTPARNPDQTVHSDDDSGTPPRRPEKPAVAASVAGHLARANDLKSQHRYVEALDECDKALQLDGANKKARVLKTNIRKAGTAQALAENDKPKH